MSAQLPTVHHHIINIEYLLLQIYSIIQQLLDYGIVLSVL